MSTLKVVKSCKDECPKRQVVIDERPLALTLPVGTVFRCDQRKYIKLSNTYLKLEGLMITSAVRLVRVDEVYKDATLVLEGCRHE